MANACGLGSLAAGALECQRTQVRRIVCRMVGDLVQPYFFRSGNLQPWVPDLSCPRGRRRIGAPAAGLPPQCDVGHDPHAPVTWETVLRLLPCMRDDALLDDMAGAIRLQACLLPDDTLMPVNLGPGLARPVPTREQEHVRVERKKPGGGEAKTAWTLHPDADLAPSSLPPFHNRLIHASVREPGLQTVHCRVAMRAPHPVCSSEEHRQANLAALRSLFAPDRIPGRLSVVCELGLESLRDSALPRAHCLYNALCARRQVIQFLDEACTVADFAAQLIEQLESPDATFSWADLRDRAQLGQPYVAQLVKHWHQIPVWTPAGVEKQPGDTGRFLWTDASLKFKAPAPYDRQRNFLAQLLQTRNAVLVRAGAHSDAFYRCAYFPRVLFEMRKGRPGLNLFVLPAGGYPYSKRALSRYLATLKRHKGVHDGWELFDNRLFYWWAVFDSRAARGACARDLKGQGFDSRMGLPKSGCNVDRARLCKAQKRG